MDNFSKDSMGGPFVGDYRVVTDNPTNTLLQYKKPHLHIGYEVRNDAFVYRKCKFCFSYKIL